MKYLLVLIFLTASSAAQKTEETEWGKVETKKLYVPESTDEWLKNITAQGYIERIRGERIANGFDAGEGQFPFALRVTVHDTDGAIFVCSGALIGPSHFLTVRHCFDPVLSYMVMAFTGTVHRDEAGWIHRVSSQWWFAPAISGWNPDLAVVALASPFPITDRISPIRLPSRSQINSNYAFNRYPINIVGWGRMANGEMAQRLQWARFRIETSCWSNPRPTTMCSVPVDGWHVETLGGDSGGPWAAYEGGIPTLVAIHEGSTGSSSVWWFRGTRLTSFTSWISGVTGIPIRD